MKTLPKFLLQSLVALSCCAALGLTTVRADGGSDDNEQGGEIEGMEDFHVELAMTPTASAPAGSSIQLSLEAEDDDGTTEAELQLQTHSLPAGTYSVNVTLKSDGSTVALGTFTVDAEGEAEIEFQTNPDNESESEGGDDDGEEQAAAPFPAGFNPLDIATVTVSDANGTPLFTADLTSATANTNINATVQATAGASAPNATGTATLSAFTRKGQVKGALQLLARSLPTKTPVTLSINGVAAKNLKTDKSGGVSAKLGPKGNGTVAPGVNLMDVHTVTLRDQSGNVLLSANF